MIKSCLQASYAKNRRGLFKYLYFILKIKNNQIIIINGPKRSLHVRNFNQYIYRLSIVYLSLKEKFLFQIPRIALLSGSLKSVNF